MKRIFWLGIYLLFVFPIFAKASDLTITPIDYVNGDSTLLESNGKYLLMDVGEGNDDTVINYLESNGVTEFDLYLSHYHGDHYGSDKRYQAEAESKKVGLLHYIMSLNGTKYTIKNIYIPAVSKRASYTEEEANDGETTDEEKIYKNHDYFVKTAQLYNINCVQLQQGDVFSFGKTTAKVLYLNQDYTIYLAPNNSSLVTKFTTNDKKASFLTAGDIEQSAEKEILKRGIDVSADIFKMSHHGGQTEASTSNIPVFLSAISPKYIYLQSRYKKFKDFGAIINGGYYYMDESKQIKLSDVVNVYNNYNSKNAKFIINSGKITPVMNDTEMGRTITLEFVDKDTGEKLEIRNFDFSLRSTILDDTKNKNKYHLFPNDYDLTFDGYKRVTTDEYLEKLRSATVSENKTYTIEYTKNTYTLTIRHMDENGNKLLDDEVFNYVHNTKYTTSASDKLLEEYKLIEQPKNSSSIITKNEVVIYRYSKKQGDGNNSGDDNNLNEDNNDINKPDIKEEITTNPQTGINTLYIFFSVISVIGFCYIYFYYKKMK